MNRDIPRPEVRNIGSRNWTGCVVRAERAAKAGCVARAVDRLRVGNTPRITDIARAGHAVSLRWGNQGCGHHNRD